MPWDDTVHARFETVEQEWAGFRSRWIDSRPTSAHNLRAETVAFASNIDVASIELHLAYWTAVLHLLQMAMLGIAVVGATALAYTGYLFVLEPVGQLKQAIEKIELGDFNARVERLTSDEFGT